VCSGGEWAAENRIVRNAERVFLHDVGRGFDCMSYTMTLDMPDSAVSFFTRNGTRSQAELGAIFVAFMKDRMGYVTEERANPFAAFCGTWTDDVFNEFQDATRRTVNPEDWQ